MLVRLVHFLIGLALGAGGGFLVWTHRAAANAPLFPPGPEGLPWLLIAGLAGVIAGLVCILTAVIPRPKRAAQRAAANAWRESKLTQADDYYARTKDAPQDRDWRSGLLPPEPTPQSREPEPEPVKAEPAKPEPAPKIEPLFKPDSVKPDPVKPDPVKPDPVKPDFGKMDLFTPELFKADPVKPELASSQDPLLKPVATNEDLFEPVPPPPSPEVAPVPPPPEPPAPVSAPVVTPPLPVLFETTLDAAPEPAGVAPMPARLSAGKPTATSIPPEGAATPFPSAATLAPIPKSSDPPPAPAGVAPAAAPATPGAFDAIRAAISEGRLDEADRMLTTEKDRAEGEALAELTGLAGDHAAAAGRQSNAKWLWRLALKRFGECNAMNSPAARAVSERLRLSDN
ncbi:MAG TPA: hypothetical protein VGO52_08225 [Hyphomonadaceae bacterium]|nr:hypothetical protein [Hyphomonadaceae bacterium]